MSYLEELLPEFKKGAKIRFSSWEEGDYICVKDGEVFDEQGRKIFYIGSALILLDKWELYQEPIDWDYIIKNKCLCWFWYTNNSAPIATVLERYEKSAEYQFIIKIGLNKYGYKFCRPIRRDEVTFYEDRKDDNK